MGFRVVHRIIPFVLACSVALPGYADNLIALQLPNDTQEYRGYAIVEFADGTSAVASADRHYGQFKIGTHTVDDIHAIQVEGDTTYINRGRWRTSNMMPGSIREYTLIYLSNEAVVEAPVEVDLHGAATNPGTSVGPWEQNRPRATGGGGRPRPGKKGNGSERPVFRWGLLAILAAALAAGGAKLAGKFSQAGAGRRRFVSPHMVVAGDWRGIYDVVSVGKSGGFGDTYTVREKAWWKWRQEVLKVLKGNWTQGTWNGNQIWVEQMKHECDHLDYLEGWGYRHAPRILKRGSR